MRTGCCLAMLVIAVSAAAQAGGGQAAGTAVTPQWMSAAGGKMEFDVASVRLSKANAQPNSNFPLGPGDAYASTGGAFSASGQPLALYIFFAYKLQPNRTQQMLDALPGWAKSESYDIEAKSENHDPTKDQMRLMMQALLVNRFKLKMHYEERQQSVYVLTVAKPGTPGPQLKAHTADSPCPEAGDAAKRQQAKAAETSLPALVGVWPDRCGELASVMPGKGIFRVGGRNVPMKAIVSLMGPFAGFDRPVTDQTGLEGNYDFVMEYAVQPTPGAPSPPDFDSPGPDIFLALKDQLGLKLESQKGAVETVVIDHVERPSEN